MTKHSGWFINDYDRGRFSVSLKDVHSVDSKDLDKLVTLIEPKDDQVILDLCCGSGDVSKHLLKYMADNNIRAKVVLVDNSWAQIAVAKKNLNGYPDVTFKCDDALELKSIKDNSIDTVVIKMGVHDVNDHHQNILLKQAYRVTKPGGKIEIWDLELDDKTKGPFSDIIRRKNELCDFSHLVENRTFVTVEEMTRKLEQSGFKDIKIEHRMTPVLSMNSRKAELTSVHRTQIMREKDGKITKEDESLLQKEADQKLIELKSAVKKRLNAPEDQAALGFSETMFGDIILRQKKAIFSARKEGARPVR